LRDRGDGIVSICHGSVSMNDRNSYLTGYRLSRSFLLENFLPLFPQQTTRGHDTILVAGTYYLDAMTSGQN
jgi:uncharacterized protein YcgI (DUF1989 family)